MTSLYFLPSLLLVALLAAPDPLPPGQGRSALIRACSSCHGADAVVGARNTRQGWAELVDEMVFKGAKLSSAEKREIVNYLARNFAMRPAR